MTGDRGTDQQHSGLPFTPCTTVPPETGIATSSRSKRHANAEAAITTPKEYHQLAIDICRGTAASVRLGRPADNTLRARALHHMLTMDGEEMLRDRLICARQESPSGKALQGRGLERGNQKTLDGQFVLANVLCYRVLYYGRPELLQTWRLFRSDGELMEHMLSWEEDRRRRAGHVVRQAEVGAGDGRLKRKRGSAARPDAEEQARRLEEFEVTAVGKGAVYGNYVIPPRDSHPEIAKHYFTVAREIWNQVTGNPRKSPTWEALRLQIRNTKPREMGGSLLPSLVVSDMARLGWVSLPTSLDWEALLGPGARKGLAAMTNGGNSTAGSISSRAESFMMRLQEDLPREDREALVFDRIFVEHLLCKVKRFASREHFPRVINIMLEKEEA